MSGIEVLAGTDRRLRLPGGRTVRWSELGDPDGTPVVYGHGGLSCRLDAACLHGPARELGVRVLALDRPGIGDSDPQPGRRIADWPADVAAVLDALGVEGAPVLGWSAGAVYALACGARLGSRVSRLGVVGGMAPLRDPRDLVSLGLRADRLLFPLAARSLGATRAALRATSWAPPRLAHASLLADLRGDDRDVVEALGADVTTAWFAEAVRRTTLGTAQDYALLGGDWGLDLAAVTAPVDLWQGADDRLVPLDHAERLLALLPDAELHLVARRGHFLLQHHPTDVLAALVR